MERPLGRRATAPPSDVRPRRHRERLGRRRQPLLHALRLRPSRPTPTRHLHAPRRRRHRRAAHPRQHRRGPYSTADVAGVPDRTGYNILLWRIGGPNQIAAASLTGPRGAVDVRPIDSRSPPPPPAAPSGTPRSSPPSRSTPAPATPRPCASPTAPHSQPGPSPPPPTAADSTAPTTRAAAATPSAEAQNPAATEPHAPRNASPSRSAAARATLRITASATPGMRRWGLLTFKDRRGRTLSTRGTASRPRPSACHARPAPTASPAPKRARMPRWCCAAASNRTIRSRSPGSIAARSRGATVRPPRSPARRHRRPPPAAPASRDPSRGSAGTRRADA